MTDLVPQYLAWLEGNNKSNEHIDVSRRVLNNVLRRMRGVKTAEDITPAKIQDFKTGRLREVSPHTVNLELGYLKAFLKRCVKEGWFREMPAEIEQIQAPGPGRLVPLCEDEINPFLDALKPRAREAAKLILL